MIRAADAIRTARSLIGTPYREMDCIALVIQIIRRSPGGMEDYRCQGTNWLWDSVHSNGKYRHLTWRQESIEGAKAGMLVFKRYGVEDVGHVGLATGEGTVIHSSSEGGRGVVETPLSARQGWDLMGSHRYIELGEAVQEMQGTERIYRAKVVTKENSLNLRDAPENGRVIGKMPIGAIADVLSEGVWPRVEYNGMQGYASAQYLMRIEEEAGEEDAPGVRMILKDSAGNEWIPEGGFSVEMRKLED